VLEPPRTNLEIQTISSLKTNAGNEDLLHRVRVSGVVTFQDAQWLFVQDDSGAARVQYAQPPSTHVGDVVEVIGFPEQYNWSLVLTEASVQKLSRQAAVEARALDLSAPAREIPNQALVRLRANLLGKKEAGNGQALELQAGQRMLEAVLAGQEQLPVLGPGSLLEITGVCMVDFVPAPGPARGSWENASIGAVRVLLRQPGDVLVLKGPPWWNWKKAAALIAALIIMLSATLLRVHLMRRRFERQQAARLAFARQLLENQESERRRIAANLHDTLGQNLLAIKNQAHLALQSSAENSALHRRLESISGTVLHALEEVRQITHDLRPYQLDRLGLSQAIRALVRRVSEASPIELAVHVDNIDGLFPKESEINIYRIVQEGINNVMKHSQATEAAVVLKAQNGLLTIAIRDNGRGLLETTKRTEEASAGFGLSGIRERARIMGGTVEVDAPPGQGFNLKVEIAVPRPASPVMPDTNETEVAHR
jgi:signal transduction histidine kinase